MNVDGLPLTSSSKLSLWPILISFVNIQHLSQVVIPVGLYHRGSIKNLLQAMNT